ncbi:probable WRKY transcription factor 70 [Olea europaea subsp. europaea]|uniref:Probable WRKY transcription factor 70 n=1 Tax=Olea europaea subsp. europaea TaxID=158383 RepID=A0A8S0SBR9_OLEEU|nr:probable WRKY transcription factor 70 [Olea europaea subsp. europaea]
MTSLSYEDLLTKRKMVMGELVRGKETATQLKTLLQKPVNDHRSVLAKELSVKVFRSFTEILSMLNYGGGANKRSLIAAGDLGGSSCSEKISQVDAGPSIPFETKEDIARSDMSDTKSSPDSSLCHDMKSLEPLMVWSPKMKCLDMEGFDEFCDLDFTFD